MTLRPEHVEVLRVRGISAAFAEAHGLHSVETDEANAILRRNDVKSGGIAIPYSGTDLVVVRLDVPLRLPNGHEAKYPLPIGARTRLYIPPETHAKLATGLDLPLIGAEGPLKALSLLEAGFAVVGLVSCTTWGVPRKEAKNPNGPRELHEDLRLLPLDGRLIVVMLDEDAAWKRAPAHEERAFLEALLQSGRTARRARVPRIRGLEKAGIDDWLGKLAPDERRPFVGKLIAEAKALDELAPLSEAGLLLARFDAELFDVTPDGEKPDAVRIGAALRVLGRCVEKARLDDIERPILREGLAHSLGGLGIKSPGALADALLKRAATETDGAGLQGKPIAFEQIEPWPDPVDGAALLEEMRQTIERYMALLPGVSVATALWVLADWALDAWTIFPRLAIVSPTMRCGKSRLLDILEALVPRPKPTVNLSVAVLFRIVDRYRPTLLIDEADRFVNERAEELIGILNAGHKRGATVERVEGDGHEVRSFDAFGPAVLARIGTFINTLTDRSIRLPQRRRAKGEKVDRLNLRTIKEELLPLRRKSMRWAADHVEALKMAEPTPLAELDDRAWNNWEPLFAVADAVGGSWPSEARVAVRALCGADAPLDEGTGVELLWDLKTIFDDRKAAKLATGAILDALKAIAERSWSTWGKSQKGLNDQGLAMLLKPFGLRSKDVKLEGKTLKGYERAAFEDAWGRYPPPSPRDPDSQPATPRQPSNSADPRANPTRDQDPPVADPHSPARQANVGLSRSCGANEPFEGGNGVLADQPDIEEGIV